MTSVLFTNVRIFDGLLGVMKDGVFHKDPQKGPARGRFSRPAA